MNEHTPHGRLLLVRHGETAYNAEGRFRGRADPPLTPRGRLQARVVGARLADLAGPLLVSSPRIRARATAEAIAEQLRRPASTDERLDDLDYGRWTGLEPSEAAVQWPDEFELWRNGPDRLSLPGGERVGAARDRVWRACRDLIRAAPLVIAVTHDACIRMAICALLGAPLASMHRLRVDLASVTEIAFRGPAWHLALANDTSHLRHLEHEVPIGAPER